MEKYEIMFWFFELYHTITFQYKQNLYICTHNAGIFFCLLLGGISGLSLEA